MCCRAGIACCTVRVTRHECCILPRVAVGCKCKCAGRGAQGCPAEQGPCTPGLCRGRDFAACQGQRSACLGDPMAAAVGGRSDPRQGRQGAIGVEGGCVGQGCSELQIPPETWQRVLLNNNTETATAAREGVCAFSFPLLLVWVCSGRWGFISLFGADTETPVLVRTCLSCS